MYVSPGPRPLLRTYPESGSRELGGIRSDQVVGRTTKAKKIPGTRNMRKISEKMVTMTHAGICWVKQESVWWVYAKSSALSVHIELRSKRPVVTLQA